MVRSFAIASAAALLGIISSSSAVSSSPLCGAYLDSQWSICLAPDVNFVNVIGCPTAKECYFGTESRLMRMSENPSDVNNPIFEGVNTPLAPLLMSGGSMSMLSVRKSGGLMTAALGAYSTNVSAAYPDSSLAWETPSIFPVTSETVTDIRTSDDGNTVLAVLTTSLALSGNGGKSFAQVPFPSAYLSFGYSVATAAALVCPTEWFLILSQNVSSPSGGFSTIPTIAVRTLDGGVTYATVFDASEYLPAIIVPQSIDCSVGSINSGDTRPIVCFVAAANSFNATSTIFSTSFESARCSSSLSAVAESSSRSRSGSPPSLVASRRLRSSVGGARLSRGNAARKKASSSFSSHQSWRTVYQRTDVNYGYSPAGFAKIRTSSASSGGAPTTTIAFGFYPQSTWNGPQQTYALMSVDGGATWALPVINEGITMNLVDVDVVDDGSAFVSYLQASAHTAYRGAGVLVYHP